MRQRVGCERSAQSASVLCVLLLYFDGAERAQIRRPLR
jgi:hypothetical protein